MNKRLIGSEREEQAAAFLRARGMEILVHSFRCRLGEIDLVARDGDTLVFVEVKYRYSGRFGWGEEHVDRKKQATIVQWQSRSINFVRRTRFLVSITHPSRFGPVFRQPLPVPFQEPPVPFHL